MMEWICDEDPATVVVGAVAAILLLPDVGLTDDAHGVPLVGRNVRVHLGEKVLQVLHGGASQSATATRSG